MKKIFLCVIATTFYAHAELFQIDMLISCGGQERCIRRELEVGLGETASLQLGGAIKDESGKIIQEEYADIFFTPSEDKMIVKLALRSDEEGFDHPCESRVVAWDYPAFFECPVTKATLVIIPHRAEA